jgi:hypothetical protein
MSLFRAVITVCGCHLCLQVGMAVLTRGLRPRIPPDCPQDYATLMEACWQAEPRLRPSFVDIVEELTRMVAEP